MTHALQERIGYRFQRPGLLEEALTHPSCSNARGKNAANNQRLEFLGDSVLGLVVAHLLYDSYTRENEGSLARRHAALVSGATLVEVARRIGLPEAITMTASEAAAGGRSNPATLEDACEALIGALFLDGGLPAAEHFIRTHWTALAAQELTPPKDAKTTLQEWAQARGLPLPQYHTVDTRGPAHAPRFVIEATVQGHPPTRAEGATKRQAEHAAAKELLEQLSASGVRHE